MEAYVSGARVGPQCLLTKNNLDKESCAALLACQKSLIWVLARQTDHAVPSWTGFNIQSRDEEPIVEDVIGYLPTINAPATELSTVFEILNQSEQIQKELQLEVIVVVMDQALYAKATEIIWKHNDVFSSVLLRMGAFHTICNALSILGK